MELGAYIYVEKYLRENPNELSESQKAKLRRALSRQLNGTIPDELLDYMLWLQKKTSRTGEFYRYLAQRIDKFANRRILEVGCGRRALLARRLIEAGLDVDAIDPVLEIESDRFRKEAFEYTYDLSQYGLVVAMEPCEATEIILRSCLANHVPCIVVACGSPHKAMNGMEFENCYYYWQYLRDISPDISFAIRPMLEGYVWPIFSYMA